MKRFSTPFLDENALWAEYQASGVFEVEYGGGKILKVWDRLLFWINTDDYDSSEDSFGFFAGYGSGTEISDSFNVPDHVIETLFPDDDIDCNSAESYHYITIPDGENAAECMARVANTFTTAGFLWTPDCD